ncbi:hypothetical protein PsYK624_128050 [Phanerochaete sordida]|uniref:Uncharacterized protein n=1 Tax=Phanerochaete sordida TaxID=48140 RepID=A0A9P3GKF7_9APHY|nr:hypothetical protein PsYK624_128050 [Phanerochaete sordida]
MCQQVLLVNRHRGCQHNVPQYHTGETFDCGQPNCALSSAHAHADTYPCKCNRIYVDYIRVQNLIQEKCDACKEAELGAYSNRGRHY